MTFLTRQIVDQKLISLNRKFGCTSRVPLLYPVNKRLPHHHRPRNNLPHPANSSPGVAAEASDTCSGSAVAASSVGHVPSAYPASAELVAVAWLPY